LLFRTFTAREIMAMATVRAKAVVQHREPVEAVEFYRAAVAALLDAGPPFLVGGGYAFRHYTGIERYTKDLDLFVRPRDGQAVLDTLAAAGHRTEMVFPHWLGKVYGGDAFIDVVFSSGNGVAVVDDEWFDHAEIGQVLGLALPVCPAEETIWSKAFVAERERYDGADIAHLIHARGDRLDWSRLLRRFGARWRVLMSHLVLYGFIYPGERERVPAWVMSALMRRLSGELGGDPPDEQDRRLCRGTLLSREQYLPDLDAGYCDARLDDGVWMSAGDIALWTRAIDNHGPPPPQPPPSCFEGGREAGRRR
jgi:hypothetical protein